RKIDRARPSRVNGPTPRLSSPGTATHSAKAEVSTPSTKITATLGAMAGTMEPRMMYSSCQLRGRGRTIIGRRSGRWVEGADGPVGPHREARATIPARPRARDRCPGYQRRGPDLSASGGHARARVGYGCAMARG